MSARMSDSTDFCRAKFKDCTPANTSHNSKMVAKNFGDVTPQRRQEYLVPYFRWHILQELTQFV